MNVRGVVPSVSLVLLTVGAPGCILGNRPTLVQIGSREDQITYYLDGAGNYGFGKESVPLGLADGGYQGHLQHYIWTTYLGPVMDQVSLSHNRREGRELAAKIQTFLDRHPDGEVNLIGLSAGTGVVVFALEALELKHKVQNVVMLSSSLSADYDLTAALRRVDGGMYFLWSPDDPILADVVPILGTVDRSSHDTAPAGMWGARMPSGGSEFTRDLYSRKVHNIRWHTEPILGPLRLPHAGSISRSVIREMVAPILVHNSRAAQPPEPKAVPPPAPKTRAPSGTPTTKPKAPAARLQTRPAPQRPAAASPAPARREPALITVGAPTTAPAKSIPATRPSRLAP